MNTTEILTKIKTLLGVENEVQVNLAQMKLEDGITIVEAENFEAGDEIMIITEDGKVALPVGDYKLEDGKMIVIKEEGVIAEVKDGEEKEAEEEVEEVEKKDEEEKEKYAEETATPKKVVESVTKESYFSEVEKLKTDNENLKKELEELKLSLTKKDSEETKVEETKTEDKVELATDEVTKINFNPENKKEVEGFKYSPNRMETTLDRVMRKLSE
ncbi:MAG: hypothetical protein Unbinned2819contig1004_35 [Prokaryotic dsDNA virus sp.]|nr:MAG: hypothetical protein Unbinned2819contig1004_35 [Prokaryotic dsDNA virus sp.]|tara:strand:- start:9266 stop:9910 length:645 start_codon:yes stop_codon:yes gene_type:complete